MKREDFASQRQGLFLFRQAALTLVSIMVRPGCALDENAALARQAGRSIERVLAVTWGHTLKTTGPMAIGAVFSIWTVFWTDTD